MPTPSAPLPVLGLTPTVVFAWFDFISPFWSPVATLVAATLVLFTVLGIIKALAAPKNIVHMGIAFQHDEIAAGVRARVKRRAIDESLGELYEANYHPDPGVIYEGLEDED